MTLPKKYSNAIKESLTQLENAKAIRDIDFNKSIHLMGETAEKLVNLAIDAKAEGLSSVSKTLSSLAKEVITKAEELKKSPPPSLSVPSGPSGRPKNTNSNSTSTASSQISKRIMNSFKEAIKIAEKATRCDKDGRPATALIHYKEAASHFIRLAKVESDEEFKDLVAKKAAEMLRRAEQLTISVTGRVPKSVSTSTSTTSTSSSRKFPHFPKAAMNSIEMRVLGESTTINGTKYPIWNPKDEIILSDIELLASQALPGQKLNRGGHLFVDTDRIDISQNQAEAGAIWMIPEDIVDNPVVFNRLTPGSIRQTLIPNCSIISSFIVCATWEQKFKKPLISNCLFPQDRTGLPVLAPTGKYNLRLILNGAPRKVTLDDRLIVSSQDKKYLSGFSKNPNEIWVQLFEKGMLKVWGSYDFPGSTSSVDIFALCGWLPEDVDLNQGPKTGIRPQPPKPKPDPSGPPEYPGPPGTDEPEPSGPSLMTMFDSVQTLDKKTADDLWARIARGHKKGSLLITASTGEMDETQAEAIGMVPTHAYAVVDLRLVNGVRLLLIKNPWSNRVYKGDFCAKDQRWTPAMKQALSYDPNAEDNTGIFWINYETFLKVFRIIHLSWDPSRFKLRRVVHGKYVKRISDEYTYAYNPQYRLSIDASKGPTMVWLLVQRHTKAQFIQGHVGLRIYECPRKSSSGGSRRAVRSPSRSNTDTGEDDPENPTSTTVIEVDDDDDDDDSSDSAHALAHSYQRIYHHPQQPSINKQIVYTSSPLNLIKLSVPAGIHHYTMLVVASEEKVDFSFSIFTYSIIPTSISYIPEPRGSSSSFSFKFLGGQGNFNNLSKFLKNPQFSFTLDSSDIIMVKLEVAPRKTDVLPVVYWLKEPLKSKDMEDLENEAQEVQKLLDSTSGVFSTKKSRETTRIAKNKAIIIRRKKVALTKFYEDLRFNVPEPEWKISKRSLSCYHRLTEEGQNQNQVQYTSQVGYTFVTCPRPGKYIVIPSTFDGSAGGCRLTVLCSKSHKNLTISELTKDPPDDWKPKKIKKPNFNDPMYQENYKPSEDDNDTNDSKPPPPSGDSSSTGPSDPPGDGDNNGFEIL